MSSSADRGCRLSRLSQVGGNAAPFSSQARGLAEAWEGVPVVPVVSDRGEESQAGRPQKGDVAIDSRGRRIGRVAYSA